MGACKLRLVLPPSCPCFLRDLSLQQCVAENGPKVQVARPSQALILTVMPACSGGGAKDDKTQVVKARIAQACLEQGYSLPQVNKIGTQLVQHAPVPKLLAALDAHPSTEMWMQLQALMQAQGIKQPVSGKVSAVPAIPLC